MREAVKSRTITQNLDNIRFRAKELFRGMFEELCTSIEQIDGKLFIESSWGRDRDGNLILTNSSNEDNNTYIDRSLLNGNVFEKVGVNYVALEGKLPAGTTFKKSGALVVDNADLMNNGSVTPYFATGASFVIHPQNPMVPTAHVNYRYFQVGDSCQPSYWWFGGGADLTPSYLFEEDAVHFHRVHKQACDLHHPDYYSKFKKWCDEYFFIKHRGESRGIGGIFFDHLNDSNPEKILDFVADCTGAFSNSYIPIVERRKNMNFTEENKYWQRIIRGRYVEFILTSDRGLRFGLESGMVSHQSVFNCMPPQASWKYDDRPSFGTQEAVLMEVLCNNKQWV